MRRVSPDQVFFERVAIFGAGQIVAGDHRDVGHFARDRRALGVLGEPAAEVERVADEERRFVVAAEQVNARLAVEPLGLEAAPAFESG